MKTSQLQIRVSDIQKKSIQAAASKANMDMSTWVLSRLFSSAQSQFIQKVETLSHASISDRKYAFADMNDFLSSLTADELTQAIMEPWPCKLNSISANYLCAMIEQVAHQKQLSTPKWVSEVLPLEEPYFATDLVTLKPYLMRVSPLPFRSRNIFIDSSIGSRV